MGDKMDHIDVIKNMPKIHCARGPKRCEKCQEFLDEGDSLTLIRVFLKPGEIARPMTEMVIEDEKIFCEYDVLQRFESEEVAMEYAMNKKIPISYD
jgi:hypothetical protein